MATAKFKCQWCGKVALEQANKARSMVFGKEWVYLECGHTLIRDAIKIEGFQDMVSNDGRSPFGYQTTTAEFAEKANLNYMCAHEMGLGKTVIQCLLIKRHLEEIKPLLIVCKSGLRMQWWTEIFRWTGHMAQIIESSSDKPEFDFFDIFIVSFDSLRLLRPVMSEDEKKLADEVSEDEKYAEIFGRSGMGRGVKKVKWTDDICSRFKSICIDETQQIKNPASARTQSLKDIIRAACFDVNGKEQDPPRIQGYSGTPIKSKPSEYQPLLGMIRPERFGNHDKFKREFVRFSTETGKEVGLRDPDRFHDITKDFIIRFERSEVMPDLPKIFRQFRLAEMQGHWYEIYRRTVKEFQEFMDIQEKSPSSADLLGWFSRMRNITGVAKINQAIEFTEEFLLSNERKIVLFIHHKEVAKGLMEKLSKLMKAGAWEAPLEINSSMDMRQRHEALEEFKKPQYRVLVASQLAAGEGLNMQFCSDCLMVERQWTPAAEEQCEARFPRPGTTAQVINVWYLIADGTIDEFLTELVEQKRAICRQVMNGEEVDWNQGELMQELAEALRTRGLKKFRKPGKPEAV